MFIAQCFEASKGRGAGSRKYLLAAERDGVAVECAFLVGEEYRGLCCSAQAGCAFACRHCATTYAARPFLRNLSAAEIFAMVRVVVRDANQGRPLDFVDFSGVGDCCANWDAVRDGCLACREHGLCNIFRLTSIAPRTWCQRLTREMSEGIFVPERIVISLHGADLATRAFLIPCAEDPTLAAAWWSKLYGEGRVIDLNYAVHQHNSTPQHVNQLIDFVRANAGWVRELRLSVISPVPNMDLHTPENLRDVYDAVSAGVPSGVRMNCFSSLGGSTGLACGQMRAGMQTEWASERAETSKDATHPGLARDSSRSSGHRLAAAMARVEAEAGVRVPHLKECLYVTPTTYCNLKCRFCAHSKSSITKGIMAQALFVEIVDKACAYGFDTFGLTPMLGEAAIDPRFLDKLDILERHPGVGHYSFCSNLTVADAEFIDRIMRLHKLRWFPISLYGHDAESFSRVTQSPGELFFTALEQLERLSEWPAIAEHVELRIRTTVPFQPDRCHPRLRDILKRLADGKVRVRIPNDRYSNWSGLIQPDDVAELGIELKPHAVKTNLPCAFLFYKHTVLPDGRLNACYADDGNATMIIGDLSRQSFPEIYSLGNDAYTNLLVNQMEGRWSDSCRACTGYRRLSDVHYSYAFHRKPFLTLSEFVGML